MNSKDALRTVRVGLFVGLSLVALVAVLALIGRSRSLFSEKALLYASFDNVSGLVAGAPVRLAGVDIGIVQAIRFDDNLQVKRVRVTIGVQGKYLQRIRGDSIARLSSKGLLGDMLINISVGSSNFPPLRSGDLLRSQESEGLAQVVESLQDGVGEVRKLIDHVDSRVQVVMSDEVAQDIKRVVRASANVMESVERGDGLLHQVLYDPRLARSGLTLLSEAEQSAQRLDRALGQVNGLLAAVESGNGTLHGLLFRDDGGKLLTAAQTAVAELNTTLLEVRNGRGALHALIYEPTKTDLLADLGAAAHVLRSLAEQTEQGKGTLGGLLRDPSIYQDLKLIVGNVQRNTLLKLLVREAIHRQGLKREDNSRKDLTP